MERQTVIPQKIYKGLKIITMIDEPNIVGSYKYFAHKYPGDIDVREIITECCSPVEASLKLAIHVQDNIRELDKLYPDYLYSEFKTDLIKWTMLEVLDGKKRVKFESNGQILEEMITLKEAIQRGGVIKLDIFVWFGGRYVEMSNFMVIMVETPDGLIPLNPDPNIYIDALRSDFIAYLNGDKSKGKERNVFKAVKRLWSLSLATKNKAFLNKISPYLSSEDAEIYQIVSDLGTIDTINEKFGLSMGKHKEVCNKIIEMLDLINEKLSRIFPDFEIIKLSTVEMSRYKLLVYLNEEAFNFLKRAKLISA